jgi:hypothetical protein
MNPEQQIVSLQCRQEVIAEKGDGMLWGIGRHPAKIIISPKTESVFIEAFFGSLPYRIKYIDGIRDQTVVGPYVRCVGRPRQVLEEIIKGVESLSLKKDGIIKQDCKT